MHKIGLFRKIGVLSLASLVIIYLFHIFSGDRLLFQSDAYSLLMYFGTMTIFVTMILSIPSTLVSFTKWKDEAYNMLIVTVIIVTGFVFLFFLSHSAIIMLLCVVFITLRYLFENLKWKILFLVVAPAAILAIISLFYILKSVLLYKISNVALIEVLLFVILAPYLDYNATKNKIEKVGILSLATLLIVVVLIFINLFKKIAYQDPNTKQGKHLVMVVFDALPTEFLRRYNPKAKPTEFDAIFDDSLVFNNFYTSSPYTYGFFGTFYNGSLCSNETKCLDDDNLIRRLQKNNISVRNISWNQLTTPEGSAISSNNYSGLRSIFLTEHTALIPKIFGIKYHLTLANVGGNEMKSYLHKFLIPYNLFNRPNNVNSPNQDFFAHEVANNVGNSDKSLTIISVRWTSFFSKDWSKYNFTAQELVDFREKMDDFQYDEKKHGGHMLKIREDAAKHMSELANQFKLFLEEIRKQSEERKMTILVTSDHGKVMGNGRYDYIWHPQESAIHNPLFVINGGKYGTDDRFVDVVDLNHSVLDFFDISEDSKGKKLSIFSGKSQHEYVTTLTKISDSHKEWFFVISGLTEGKYQINIHPQGNGSVKLIKPNYFDESNAKYLVKIPKKIRDIISNSLAKEYRINSGDIHPKFRSGF